MLSTLGSSGCFPCLEWPPHGWLLVLLLQLKCHLRKASPLTGYFLQYPLIYFLFEFLPVLSYLFICWFVYLFTQEASNAIVLDLGTYKSF